jgi:hypothetical protein
MSNKGFYNTKLHIIMSLRGKLTIIGSACCEGTPFFLKWVLTKTSSLRGGRPSFSAYKNT